MNLDRLLKQSVLGEWAFSEAIKVDGNRTSSVGHPLPVTNWQLDPSRLLFICQPTGEYQLGLSACISIFTDEGPFEVLDEDETHGGPLNRSVKWRVERRFGEPIICSTFIASRMELKPLIEMESLPLETEEATITIENYISNKWKRIRRKIAPAPVDLDNDSPDSPLILINRIYNKRLQSIATIATGPSEDFLVLDQDIDFTHSPFGRPVHWRIERRGNEDVYCSTLTMTSPEIRKLYGEAVDAILGSQSKMTITLETYRSDSWRKIRTPAVDPRTGKTCSLESYLSQEDQRRVTETARHRRGSF